LIVIDLCKLPGVPCTAFSLERRDCCEQQCQQKDKRRTHCNAPYEILAWRKAIYEFGKLLTGEISQAVLCVHAAHYNAPYLTALIALYSGFTIPPQTRHAGLDPASIA